MSRTQMQDRVVNSGEERVGQGEKHRGGKTSKGVEELKGPA